MTVITEYSVRTEAVPTEEVQFEREQFDRLEQRRQIADRAAAKLGSRIAFAAYLARRDRARTA